MSEKGPHSIPSEWPLEREPNYLEAKLAPFEDIGEWQKRHYEEKKDRLGESGSRLLYRIGLVETMLEDYDMTPEEAIECLRYEIEVYENHE